MPARSPSRSASPSGSPPRQDEIGDLKIKISGCINACGHHHVGHIGILGVEKRGEEHYQLLLGGSGAEDAALASITGPGFGPDGIVDAVEKVVDTYLELRASAERALPRRLRPPRPRPLQGGALCHRRLDPSSRAQPPHASLRARLRRGSRRDGHGAARASGTRSAQPRRAACCTRRRTCRRARRRRARSGGRDLARWRLPARRVGERGGGRGRCPMPPRSCRKKRWLAERDTLAGRNAPLGLHLERRRAHRRHRRRPAALRPDRAGFPKFSDGRAFSTARLLRDKHGYAGELRAVGNVLSDQIPFMRRVGFDAFEVTHAPTRRALARGPHRRGHPALPAGPRRRAPRRHPPLASAHRSMTA